METNPITTPIEKAAGSVRLDEHRAGVATLIRQFVNEQLTAFEFDDALEPFRDSSDPIVLFATEAVWHFYDDCDDHLVALEKPDWDYLQRLLLLLESDCRLERKQSRLWSWSQFVAAAALIGFIWAALHLGWGRHLLIVSIPFGIVSIAISFLRPAPAQLDYPLASMICPFATLGDLRSAYESVAFTKQRYPKQLSNRRIRSQFMETFLWIHMCVVWLILSPFPLAAQTFPRTITDTRARTA